MCLVMNFSEIELLFITQSFGNISKAADYLGVSQPALSKNIKNLETELDIKIFTRLSRGIKLTKEGEVFFKYAKISLNNFNQAKAEVAKLRSDYTENLIITIHPLLGKYIIPKLELALQKYKNLKVDYLFQNSRIGIDEVLTGKSDFTIAADVLNYPDIVKIKLWKEFIGLYSIDGEVKDKILFNSNMINANRILKSIKYKNKKEINDYSIIYSILKRSNDMALLPNPVAENESKVKLIKKFSPPIQISLVYRADQNKTKGFQKIINILKTHSRQD